jgi:hypothetical protein
MTQAVAEAAGGAWPHPELRVCVRIKDTRRAAHVPQQGKGNDVERRAGYRGGRACRWWAKLLGNAIAWGGGDA